MTPERALADGGEAVSGRRRDRTAAPVELPGQGDAVGVILLDGGRIAEHVIERLVYAGHPTPEPVG